MTPKVDTFEHDIVDEIKRREATAAEISAIAKSTIPEAPAPAPKKSPFMIILMVLFVVSLLGLAGVGYYYYNDPLLPPSAQPIAISPNDVPKTPANLTKLSPTLATQIGRFVTKADLQGKGYVLTINDYPSVFAYMTRNENAYITELSLSFGAPSADVSTSTPIATSTPQATTTAKEIPPLSKQIPTENETSTSSTSVTGSEQTSANATLSTVPGFTVSDITVNNQNMRVFSSPTHTIIYAFVGNTKVLIADSSATILSLRSAILR